MTPSNKKKVANMLQHYKCRSNGLNEYVACGSFFLNLVWTLVSYDLMCECDSEKGDLNISNGHR